MSDRPVRHSRLANWLAGHLGFHDLYESNAILRRALEEATIREAEAKELARQYLRQSVQRDQDIQTAEAELGRLADRLEDCNRRLANLSENGSERIQPTPNE